MNRLALVCSVALVAGCATRSDNIQPASVSMIPYRALNCAQVREEVERVSTGIAYAARQQDDAANVDAFGMAVGVAVMPAMLLFTRGDGANAAELSRLRGELEALRTVNIERQCGVNVPLGRRPSGAGNVWG
jgi:hypothetical protein